MDDPYSVSGSQQWTSFLYYVNCFDDYGGEWDWRRESETWSGGRRRTCRSTRDSPGGPGGGWAGNGQSTSQKYDSSDLFVSKSRETVWSLLFWKDFPFRVSSV